MEQEKVDRILERLLSRAKQHQELADNHKDNVMVNAYYSGLADEDRTLYNYILMELK